jgi:putative hemolysin
MNSRNDHIFRLDVTFSDPVRSRIFSKLNGLLERLLLLDRLNDIYAEMPKRDETGDFVERALAALKIGYHVEPGDLGRIPAHGPLVVVANHPFGGVEGLMLAAVLQTVRPDVKIMANYLLDRIPEMRPLIIPVDPFGGGGSVSRNLRPLRDALAWVGNGGVLAVFPAGQVSHLQLTKKQVVDPAWSKMVGRIIRKSAAPVLPVFFHGRNSALFQVAGLVHPLFRTVLLPHELLNKNSTEVRLDIGNLVSAERIKGFEGDDELMAYLRARTYLLHHRRPAAKRRGDVMHYSSGGRVKQPQKVIDGPRTSVIHAEFHSLPARQVLWETDQYSVMYASAQQIPNLLYEIGRLRELTFRAVGEGTGRSIDLDRFDLYYTHLFLWHKEKGELVGAYRLAPVDRVIERFGTKGLYTSTLFTYKETFFEHMRDAVELGRSFVRLEYQKSYSPLLLLWRGVARYIGLNPQYRTLFGAVTISEMYSPASRQLIVAFLKGKSYAPHLARMVKPRIAMRPGNTRSVKPHLDPELITDIEELSAFVSDMEIDRKGVPVLLRQYIRMGGKLMGFNVDRTFANGLDGLVMVDLTKCEPKILERLMGRAETASYLTYHNQTEPERRAS